MEENLKELSSYEKIGNWNFDEISIEEEHLKKWDIYEELKKYVDEKSLVLDLGTGGGEKALKNIPNMGMLIGTDVYESMIKTPIIDDFMPNRKVEEILEESSEKSKHLEEYIKKFQTKRGIKLERRLCGFIAIK